MQPSEKTTLPLGATFTIENDVYLPANPAAGRQADELYGPEFNGSFTVAFPSMAQSMRIPAAATAAIEREGVLNPRSLDPDYYNVYWAVAYIGILATAKPPWWNMNNPGTAKFMAAIVHAAMKAERELGEAKKKSDGTPSSTTT